MREVSFTVHGEPAPQGSKVSGKGFVREANKRTKPWREQVAQVAGAAMKMEDLISGPVVVEARFVFARPASHFGSGRNSNKLKDSAPFYRTSAPDTDKLCRAVGDAVKGIVLRDDAQIVKWHAMKVWGERSFVTLRFAELPVKTMGEYAQQM